MSYNYASFQAALALEMAIPNANVNDPNFVAALPTIIDYAEQRLYRELDLLFATQSYVGQLTARNRKLTLAAYTDITDTGYFQQIEDINVITPTGTSNPELGVRNACRPVSKEYLNAVWNSARLAAVPTCYAMLADNEILLGPWPDQPYYIEVVGKYRPLPLYNAAQSAGTYLSIQLPDLFLAAAMVSATGYQKNYGAQGDNPRDAVSWESQVQELLASAKMEDQRRKFHGYQQMTSESTPPPPTPPAA